MSESCLKLSISSYLSFSSCVYFEIEFATPVFVTLRWYEHPMWNYKKIAEFTNAYMTSVENHPFGGIPNATELAMAKPMWFRYALACLGITVFITTLVSMPVSADKPKTSPSDTLNDIGLAIASSVAFGIPPNGWFSTDVM